MRLLLLLTLCVSLCAAEDPRAIVRKSVQVDDSSERLRRNYTYKVFNRLSELDSTGKAKDIHSSLEEVLYVGGRTHLHSIEKNGKPLPAGDAKKEQDKLDRAVGEASRLSVEEKNKRTEESIRKSEKQREPLKYIPDAFDFALEGETEIAGRPAWQIRATPKPGYTGQWAFLFRKISGTLWIDKADFAWVRLDATTLDTLSFGLFLMRLAKGSRMVFENMKVNDEVWMRKRVLMEADARLGLIKRLNANQELVFSDYRKFQSDSRLLGSDEPH